MYPLRLLAHSSDELPCYWRSRLEQLSLECEKEGTELTLKRLLFALRDMPYDRPAGRTNDARECITQWRGTCSAKHLAAYELLHSLALRPQLWLASYQLDFSSPYYSDVIRKLAAGHKVYDVHNYVTCNLNYRPTVIDITFPVSLGAYGLPVTETWTGNEDFVLCCTPKEVRKVQQINDAETMKRGWLKSLNTSKALALRELAIHELMEVAKRG